MNTHESYVILETAKMLKEAGFDWEIKTFYFNNELGETMLGEAKNHNFSEQFISAPTLAVAQRWLREVKGRMVLVGSVPEYFFYTIYEYKRKIDHIFIESNSPFDTYEEALEAGIKKSLTILLEEKP